MQKAVFPIQSHADITKAINFMHTNYTQALESGKPLRVVIDQKQDDRSAAQNRLYWMWLGQIEKKNGTHKDQLHFEFKKRFLIFIYRRDDQEFEEMCLAISALKQSQSEQFKAVAKGVIREASTTRATTKQFTEYLNCVHDFTVTRLGIHLTVPDDLKWCFDE